MNKGKFSFILFIIFFIFTIYNFYLIKKIETQLKSIELSIKISNEYQKVLGKFKFLNTFAKDYGLISSELKFLPSEEEFIFVYQFKSKELFEDFIKDKGKSETYLIWESSLKNSNVLKIKFIDKDNNIIKVLEKNKFY